MSNPGGSASKDFSKPIKLTNKGSRSKSQYKTTKLVKVTRLHTRKGSENINPRAANKLVNKPLENMQKNNSVNNDVAQDPKASSFSKVGTQSERSNQLAANLASENKNKESQISQDENKSRELK